MYLLIVLIGCVLSTNARVPGEETAEEWTNFLIKYEKHYRSVTQWYKREAIFKQNLKSYRDHNELYEQGKVSYMKGINKFSDMTEEEIFSYINPGLLVNFPESIEENYAREAYSDVGEFMDWRNYGAVTPVKDMGNCGDGAYAFSAAGAIEGQLKIVRGFLTNVSTQNFIDCSWEQGNKYCSGGLMSYCFDYVTDYGIESDEIYPYKGYATGECSFESHRSLAKLKTYVNITRGSEKALQNAIAIIGPISVGLHVSSDFLSYKSGIFNDEVCRENKNLNFAALAVGYGTENGVDYYIVKNSFGADWGENGYFRLIRNQNNACGIATFASYPVLS